MSNYPPTPSFWGSSNNYTQQWASQPPISNSLPHHIPFNQDLASAQAPPQGSGGHTLDYTNHDPFYANAHLPGLGGPGAPGSLPPPPFPFPGTFPTSQFPPPPFPIPMPNMGYHPPVPNTHSRAPTSRPSTGELTHAGPQNAPDSRPMTTSSSRPDYDREEGELTDMEGPTVTQPTQDVTQPHARTVRTGANSFGTQKPYRPRKQRKYGNPAKTPPSKTSGAFKFNSRSAPPKDSEPDSSDQEGDASADPHSSRESGSPYNPPISMDTNQSPPVSSKPSQPSSSSIKSPAELRVQAQGALLSLAPHSIRFQELVGEGIDPMVLKQLYEDVGIKVPATLTDAVPGSGSSSDDLDRSETSQSEVAQHTKQQLEATAPPKQVVVEAVVTPQSSVPTSKGKPMERKEVIARMLAAKAAQSSRASAPPQTDATQSMPSPNAAADVDKSTASTPSQEATLKDKEVRGKEKNKAQTELARQRIEQLKKQGLMRNQQKSQQALLPTADEEPTSTNDSSPAQVSVPIQHPLPERPPDPELEPLGRIPGLFMTEQAPDLADATGVAPVEGLVVDPTPQPRTSQRKRPRASDFDEPIPIPKRSFSNGVNHSALERLVIDISDDEFYGDDEDGSMDVDTPAGNISQDFGALATDGLPKQFSSSIETLPHRPGKSPSQGLSLSSTPLNSRNNEHEDLRRKDLEIQAMHRKIAELELRKKAKLASRTQSPRNSDLSTMSPPTNAAAIEPVNIALLPAEPGELEVSVGSQEQISISLEVERLKELKLKLLRKEEIESGVPSLDAEIQKSEAKLANFKKEEEDLLLQIAKGKNGRRQLLEELKALNLELDGLSLERLEAALNGSPLDEEPPARDQAQAYERDSSVLEISMAELQSLNDAGSSHDSNPPGEAFAVATPESIVRPNPTSNAQTDVVSSKCLSNDSLSEDSGSSAMDESSDSSSSSSAPVDQESSDEQSEGIQSAAPEGVEESLDVNLENSDKLNAENLHDSLPDHLQLADIQAQADVISSSGDNAAEATANSASSESAASEVYEPPEPEATTSPAGSTYSPSFSPASPPAGPMEVSRSPEDQSNNTGELLTGKIQELDLQQPSRYSQVGPLDNQRRPEELGLKFTPYVSPLKQFRAYRYHPNYTDNVSGGYRSLTYSHNIDPMKFLCPFEAAGGVCNDRSCEFQHFRDMSLSDDKVLVQMGSLREGKTPEQSDDYITGLKQIINEMRRDKVKDFNTVATEIAAYRRRFLQDPSRVLPL